MATEKYRPTVARRSVRHDVRGVDYHVSEWGDPSHPLLFMLHGWGDAGSTFQFVVDALAEDWFVVAPDWRGFGESAHSGPAYWFPDYIADLDALAEIYSPDQRLRLLGHSMGGNIAALFAGVFPEKVAAVINIEGFGLANRSADDAPGNFRRWIERGRQPQAYSTYSSFEEFAKRIATRTPHMPAERALFAAEQWGRIGADGSVTIKADAAHKLPNAVLYRRAESEACWREVTAEVLVVVGADSEFRDGADSRLDTEPGALVFPSMRIVTIEGAGHMVHFEQPESLARATESFLARIDL